MYIILYVSYLVCKMLKCRRDVWGQKRKRKWDRWRNKGGPG